MHAGIIQLATRACMPDHLHCTFTSYLAITISLTAAHKPSVHPEYVSIITKCSYVLHNNYTKMVTTVKLKDCFQVQQNKTTTVESVITK